VVKTAMRGAERIFTKPDAFPELTLAALAPGARVRRRRSSFREAQALVAKDLVRCVDRRTWRVGIPRPDGLCAGRAIKLIEKATQLPRATVCEVLRSFEEAKYIESTQPVEELAEPKLRANGTLQTHRGFPSVRWVTPLGLKRLGITDEKRKAASADGAEAWRRLRARKVSPVALEGLRRFREKSRGTFDARAFETTAAERLERLRLRELHPDWTAQRITAEARPKPRP
jgi:hypothetical protein